MDTMILVGGPTCTGLRAIRPLAEPRDLSGACESWIRPVMHALVFSFLWLVIASVGAVDTFLTLKYRDVMFVVEKNPVGRFLIALNGNDVTLFVVCKIAGTYLALGVLAWIGLHIRRTISYAVIVPIAVAQLALVCYLFI